MYILPLNITLATLLKQMRMIYGEGYDKTQLKNIRHWVWQVSLLIYLKNVN